MPTQQNAPCYIYMRAPWSPRRYAKRRGPCVRLTRFLHMQHHSAKCPFYVLILRGLNPDKQNGLLDGWRCIWCLMIDVTMWLGYAILDLEIKHVCKCTSASVHMMNTRVWSSLSQWESRARRFNSFYASPAKFRSRLVGNIAWMRFCGRRSMYAWIQVHGQSCSSHRTCAFAILLLITTVPGPCLRGTMASIMAQTSFCS